MSISEILVISIIALILYIIVTYVFRSNNEKKFINKIIEYNAESDDDIYYLMNIKNKYMKTKFKTISSRGLLFTGLLTVCLIYLKIKKPFNSYQTKQLPIPKNRFFEKNPFG